MLARLAAAAFHSRGGAKAPKRPVPERIRVMQEYAGKNVSDDGAHWRAVWDKGATAWEDDMNGASAPALADLVASGDSILPRGTAKQPARVLVPGCGRGFDVWTLSASSNKDGFRNVLGMDIVPQAVTEADAFLGSAVSQLPPSEQAARRAAMSVAQGSFFDADASLGVFDLIYDYTFFCAIPPAQRPAWGRRMAELCRPGTGVLLCLMFPLHEHSGGPPYSVTPDAYREALGDHFAEVFVRPCRSQPHRHGKELLAAFSRQRP